MRTSRPNTGPPSGCRQSRALSVSSTSPPSWSPFAAGACPPSTARSGPTGVRSERPRARSFAAAKSVLFAEPALDGVEAAEDLVDAWLRHRRVLPGLYEAGKGGDHRSSGRAELEAHAAEDPTGDAVLGGEQAEQQVLAPDVVVAQAQRLSGGRLERPFGQWCERDLAFH